MIQKALLWSCLIPSFVLLTFNVQAQDLELETEPHFIPKKKQLYPKKQVNSEKFNPTHSKKPVIDWSYPPPEGIVTPNSKHVIQAQISSASPIEYIELTVARGDHRNSTKIPYQITERKSGVTHNYKYPLSFSTTDVPLYISLTAKNTDGQITTLPTRKIMYAPKRIALLIGNSKYNSEAPIANVANDVKGMKKVLLEGGFKVKAYENLTKEYMERVIGNFLKQLPDYDIGLLYMAGHGNCESGTNYFSTTDSKQINLDQVTNSMNAKRNIVFVDACRTSQKADLVGVTFGEPVVEIELQEETEEIEENKEKSPIPLSRTYSGRSGKYAVYSAKPKDVRQASSNSQVSRLVMYAADENEPAIEYGKDGKHGLFTGELIHQIRKNGGKHSIMELLENIQNQVSHLSKKKQNPQIKGRLDKIVYLR